MAIRLRPTLLVLLLINLTLVGVSFVFAKQSEIYHPPIGQFVTVDGVTMHLSDSGVRFAEHSAEHSAPALVLIHGASTSLLDFETSLKPALADKLRIVSVDRPGHGYSDRSHSESGWSDPARQARLIAAALREIGIEEAVWAGHSWAGSVVLAGLLDDSVAVSAGILIAGATHPWEGGSAWHVELSATPVIGPLFTWQYIEPIGRLSLKEAIAGVFAPEIVPSEYIDDTGVVLSLRPATYQRNAQDLTRLSDYLSRQSRHYSSISQPVLSITGSEDTVVPAWNHDARLAEQIPHLESHSLQGAGHAPHHTRTEVVSALIEAFVMRSGFAVTGQAKAAYAKE